MKIEHCSLKIIIGLAYASTYGIPIRGVPDEGYRRLTVPSTDAASADHGMRLALRTPLTRARAGLSLCYSSPHNGTHSELLHNCPY